MTTGRINQITIFKQCYSPASPRRQPREWQSKVVRFNKFCMLLAATKIALASVLLKDLCFHDLQPTRMWLLKRRWEDPSTV